ncbi:hypothetical protein SAMN05216419_10259 [Nitrosomonas cryotolerans]|uniref:Uncharacterized protein n=1 Tax=Nitrosomonas cryotolerans ATCC 49181 TaxID=1131553 RepID=A0A1N6IWF5_9PROT|nr:catalase family protein [Nitrosomonas cryotolerans]SFP85498.1 hypothetical protein SAMN05216419_10259 [Nitrosomonas cryotolerans]SIO36362.1 hypothetical protein SAMN02743940_2131 [Nitrosomonas cryotolerans ATCC 49181]
MKRLSIFSILFLISLTVHAQDEMFLAENIKQSPEVLKKYSGSAAKANSSISPTKFEMVPEGEAEQIAEIITLITQLQQQRYPGSMARRGVHPKDHGCVQAKFTVNPDLPKELQAGVLASAGKTYETWIRFSNATATVSPDIAKDGANESRGMAIKLMGVDGTTLLGKPGAKTQDFLLINQARFAFANVTEYLELTKIQLANQDAVDSFFAPPLTARKKESLDIIQEIRKTQLSNPLEGRYFSASPFLFGKDTVAKFAVTPRDPVNTSMPSNPSSDYLREALKKSLDPTNGKQAIFDFQVQIRTTDSLPIENASSHWGEDIAPFQNVATITIDKQDFDNPLRITECEHLVFTPWHGLAEHQPLGGINRLRLGVYNASAQYRAQANEPSGFPK